MSSQDSTEAEHNCPDNGRGECDTELLLICLGTHESVLFSATDRRQMRVLRGQADIKTDAAGSDFIWNQGQDCGDL